jgi:uncharacterized protein YkwD
VEEKESMMFRSLCAVAASITMTATAVAWDQGPVIPGPQPVPLVLPATSAENPGKAATQGASFAERVVEIVNQERWTYNNGQLPPLKNHALLEAAAQGHSERMATGDFFAHCDLDTLEEFFERVLDEGYVYSWVGENIAAGSSSPEAVVAGWMNSPGHRANILNTDFREIGVGYYYQAGDQSNVRQDLLPNTYPPGPDCVADSFGNGPWYRYWTQNFGARSSGYPVVIEREAYETSSRTVDLYLYGSGWATEMRIRNDCGSFGAWQAFAANVSGWELCAEDGVREVFVEIRNGGGSVRSASDTIVLSGAFNEIFSDGFESSDTTAWSAP